MKQTVYAFVVASLITISGFNPGIINPIATVTMNDITGITETSATFGGNIYEAVSRGGLVDSNFYFNLNYDGIAHNLKEGIGTEHYSFLDFPHNSTDTSVRFDVKDLDQDFGFSLNYEYSRDHAFLNSTGVYVMATYPVYNSVVATHLNTGKSDDSRELVTRHLDGFKNCISTKNAYRTITLTITSVTSSDPSKTYVINGSSFDNSMPCYIYEGKMSGELVESHSSGDGCSDDVVHLFSGSFRLICPKP